MVAPKFCRSVDIAVIGQENKIQRSWGNVGLAIAPPNWKDGNPCGPAPRAASLVALYLRGCDHHPWADIPCVGVIMGKPTFASSWLCAILCMAGAVSPVKSEDQPSPHLKNVLLVAYRVFVEPPNNGFCAIDWEAWNTAVDFVANQPTKLKLIKQKEHRDRAKELVDNVGETARKYVEGVGKLSDTALDAANKAWDEASKIHSKYLAAPELVLVANVLEQNGRCSGTVSATVTAMLKPSEMISTGKIIYHPSYEIWRRSMLLVGPPNSFSHFVIETSEQMMKSFVNDWTLSQQEY
jgi:hypothetical protein